MNRLILIAITVLLAITGCKNDETVVVDDSDDAEHAEFLARQREFEREDQEARIRMQERDDEQMRQSRESETALELSRQLEKEQRKNKALEAVAEAVKNFDINTTDVILSSSTEELLGDNYRIEIRHSPRSKQLHTAVSAKNWEEAFRVLSDGGEIDNFSDGIASEIALREMYSIRFNFVISTDTDLTGYRAFTCSESPSFYGGIGGHGDLATGCYIQGEHVKAQISRDSSWAKQLEVHPDGGAYYCEWNLGNGDIVIIPSLITFAESADDFEKRRKLEDQYRQIDIDFPRPPFDRLAKKLQLGELTKNEAQNEIDKEFRARFKKRMKLLNEL